MLPRQFRTLRWLFGKSFKAISSERLCLGKDHTFRGTKFVPHDTCHQKKKHLLDKVDSPPEKQSNAY